MTWSCNNENFWAKLSKTQFEQRMHHENYIDKWISCCLRRFFFNIDCLFLIYVLFEFVYMFFYWNSGDPNMQTHVTHIKGKHNRSFWSLFFSYFKPNKKTKDWIFSELPYVYVHLMILTYRWHNEYRASLSHFIDLNYSKKYYYFRSQTR